MKVYLSARYARMHELADYRTELEALGIEVTARWLDGSTFDATPENAQIDIDDIYAADVFVTFAEEPVEQSSLPYAARGGRHVEFGIAYECGCRCLVIGGDTTNGPAGENVFHLLPTVGRVSTWAEAKVALVALAEEELDARWRDIVAQVGGAA